MNPPNNTPNTDTHPKSQTNLQNANQALNIAKKAMKIVIFIGMIAVVLLMINIYILLNQITATAQISREIKTIKQVLKIDDSKDFGTQSIIGKSSLESSTDSSPKSPQSK